MDPVIDLTKTNIWASEIFLGQLVYSCVLQCSIFSQSSIVNLCSNVATPCAPIFKNHLNLF